MTEFPLDGVDAARIIGPAALALHYADLVTAREGGWDASLTPGADYCGLVEGELRTVDLREFLSRLSRDRLEIELLWVVAAGAQGFAAGVRVETAADAETSLTREFVVKCGLADDRRIDHVWAFFLDPADADRLTGS